MLWRFVKRTVTQSCSRTNNSQAYNRYIILYYSDFFLICRYVTKTSRNLRCTSTLSRGNLCSNQFGWEAQESLSLSMTVYFLERGSIIEGDTSTTGRGGSSGLSIPVPRHVKDTWRWSRTEQRQRWYSSYVGLCYQARSMHSDEWRAYRGITPQTGLRHRTVNLEIHKVNRTVKARAMTIQSNILKETTITFWLFYWNINWQHWQCYYDFQVNGVTKVLDFSKRSYL